jgi:hypothetical protein
MSELREKFEKTCLPIFCGYERTFQEEHDSYVDAEVDSAWIGYKIGYAQAMKDALANTNPNSAEIARLKNEIELLSFATPNCAEYVAEVLDYRRARLAELTKGV